MLIAYPIITHLEVDRLLDLYRELATYEQHIKAITSLDNFVSKHFSCPKEGFDFVMEVMGETLAKGTWPDENSLQRKLAGRKNPVRLSGT